MRRILPLILLALATSAIAGDPAQAPAADAAPASGAPAMSAEDQAMMEAWTKASTPGTEHAALNPMAGSFDVKIVSWMAPGAPPDTSSGKADSEWILGNRYLEQKYSGTFMGGPFAGVGYTGYDNIKKQYIGTWMDSMGTGMMNLTGHADASGKTFTYTGECADPMSGKPQPFKQIVTIESPNRHVIKMWTTDPKTGTEYEAMELTYTRVGTASNE